MNAPKPSRFRVIDAHTAGEPLRLIVDGLPEIPGATLLEKRDFLRQEADWIRTSLMFEPRGHADMYGCILTDPVSEDGDCGVLFLHNEGYSTMCGHGVIALTTLVLEERLSSQLRRPLELKERDGEGDILRLDTPAGRVTATAHRNREKRVAGVSFENVPSFVEALDQSLEVPGLGTVNYDLAFGGAYYALCSSESLGLGLGPADIGKLIEAGRAIKHAITENSPLHHPLEPELGFLYGTIFVGPPENPSHHSRNVCIFADGEVDRSPTGTGVSARAALHWARGELNEGQTLVIESVLGTTFAVEVVGETRVGDRPGVIPRVTGSAYRTGSAEFTLDPEDPLRHGFLLR